MRKVLSVLVIGLLFAQGAMAGSTAQSAVGGGVGGALGSVLGQTLGGSTGAAVGAGVGGAAGGALTAKKGNKTKARTTVYGALELVARRTGQDPIQVLKKAVDNIRPQVEVRSRRVGGSSYQVPVEVRPRRVDVRVNLFALAWVPRWEVRAAGQALTVPAFEAESA